jgi:Hydrogenase maturation factor
MLLVEAAIPITEEVKGACEILGLDPLYVANEGKLLAIVPSEDAEAVLGAMKSHPLATEAAVIGQVTAEHPGFVLMKTRSGAPGWSTCSPENSCRAFAKVFLEWQWGKADSLVKPPTKRRKDGNYNDHRINPESKRFPRLVRFAERHSFRSHLDDGGKKCRRLAGHGG